jgi:uncharacterized repeat protein (TIGR03803 family)
MKSLVVRGQDNPAKEELAQILNLAIITSVFTVNQIFHANMKTKWAFLSGLLLLAAPAGQAQFIYTTNGAGITLSSYTGSGGAVAISNFVTSIGDFSFYNSTNLTSVTIPNSVTSIGDEAFGFCIRLTSVMISSNVTSLGDVVFYADTSLSEITVDPSNPAYLSIAGVLFDRSQATLIEYPAGKAGSAYSIPNSVTTIGDYAFDSAPLASVTIPTNVVSIEDGAFQGTDLTNVAIPYGVTSIAFGTFQTCYNLGSVTIPSSVTSIGDSAFNFCTSLANVVIPSSVTGIGQQAFGDCYNLTSIALPNSVTSIGDDAFEACGLISVTNGSGVSSIGEDAFAYCGSLTGVYFQGNAPAADTTVFTNDNSATVYYLAGTSGWSSPFAGRPAVMLNAPNAAGSLQVNIIPGAVIAAGALWQVDGGIAQPGGATVLGLSVGVHTVSFSAVSGWTAPINQNVFVNANSTTTATGIYVLTGFVSQGIDPFYWFTGGNDGSDPAAGLIQASDGNLYGTTYLGGTNGAGAIFQMSTNGSFTALYSFTGGNDGANPSAGLVQAGDGFLYGTANSGGIKGNGTIFQMSTDGVLTPLYSFTNGSDGANPNAGLIQGTDGYLYGTAGSGGSNGFGTIFQISTNGAFTPLYSFTNGIDGGNPFASLIQAGDGFLYGTTWDGGSNGYGTVFQISTNGVFNALYSFTGGSDGAYPNASLIQASDTNLYGTTEYGGTNGYGAVFQISTSGALTSLHSFAGGNEGGFPAARLIQASGGYLFGTTTAGGTNGNGTVFLIKTNGGHFRTLCLFTGGFDGANPNAGLMQASNGFFYGTASGGGMGGNGTVFVLDPLQITPRSLLFAAPAGGPIPATNLTLMNLGTASLNWSVANTPWLNFSPSSGSLAPGTSMPLTASATSAAASLPPGTYSVVLDFTNLSDGLAQSVQVHYEALLTPLASFPGSDGATPYSPLLQARDGNLYGTTANGGNYNNGSVFRISTGGVITLLYSFTGGNDGGSSYAGLVQASDGYLYGTAYSGGTYGYGTVFQISTNGVFTSLYSFTGADDGGNPAAGLIQASDGNLYGTALGGEFYGTVYRITTSGEFSLVYSFTGADDGAYPQGALVQASDGWLYGTANQGGINGDGTVFRVSTNGACDALFSFNHTDGAYPAGALIQAPDGYLYGSASAGGARYDSGDGYGIVFRISTNGVFDPIHLFTGGSDGSNPYAGLVRAGDGSLYGTAPVGGIYGEGTVFRIGTNGAFTPLYSFTGGDDGANPYASLIQASDGSLYGTTSSGGGYYGGGTVFKLTTNGAFTLLHGFIGTVQVEPSGSLQIIGGNLYGTTEYSGIYGQGSVFQVAANGALTTVYSFSYTTGDYPESGLIQGSDGSLYGTTYQGGTYDYGTVFQISTNGAFTLLHSFSGSISDGIYPKAALVQAGGGYLYGTTYQGGTNGYGTVFRISTNGAFTSLHSFDYSDGGYPEAALVQAGDGFLYGTTTGGGSYGWGTVFRISTNGAFTSLYSLTGGNDGAYPQAALVQANDGFLYGTAYQGGTNGDGTVFQISTNGAFTSLYSFTGGNDGANPAAGLIQAANGDLYGTTSLGGAGGFGTVFQITTNGEFSSMYSFSGGSDGGDPAGGLVAFGGYLYGMNQVGGDNGRGAVYRILIPQTVAQPVTIEVLSFSGGNLIIGFPTIANQSYTVQQNTNLATSNWLPYTNFSGNGLPFQLAVPATNSPGAFFQVTEP